MIRVENGNIHKELVGRNILLRVSSNQVVELQSGDGQHWLPVELGVVESVQQMDSSRPRRGQAYP